ncbi:MAG TPA: ubiquinone biosynthesis protein UbiA [Actinobacteria bacterium]|nr:ubiquinone biosynthesis protein UbiA [Actinomycetota bacterium]
MSAPLGALGRTSGLLIRASHPAPALAVTVVMSTLAWRSGWESTPLALFTLAMLSGQLSVGWSNDAHDADMDHAAKRSDKPVVAAELSVRLLWRCALVALGISVVASLAAAGLAGAFHVMSLAAAWSYNLRLSRTGWSWLPYAVAFGLIPPFVSEGLEPPSTPTLWSILVFMAIGVAAHLANAAQDTTTDAEYGHTSSAIILGESKTKSIAVGLLLFGTALLVWQLWASNPALAVATAVLSTAIGIVGFARSTLLFKSILLLALTDVALLLLSDVTILG